MLIRATLLIVLLFFFSHNSFADDETFKVKCSDNSIYDVWTNEKTEFIDYYKSGQKSIVGNYRFGKKHGMWTYSYKDGVVALSGNYRNGDPRGSWFWIRANKSEILNVDDPDKDWVAKRIREWERIYN